MGIFSNLFGRKSADTEQKVGGMEDFMTLIRVYFQAVIASDLGITNLNALPDLRVFKVTLRVPTQGGKLGLGEKARCKKMLKELYEMDDDFFKEIDQSIRHRCKKIQDVQTYLLQFQTYVQDVMMLSGNLMKFKLRLPSFFKGAIRTATEKTVHDIFTKNDYKDASVLKTVVSVRELDKRLGFSEKWTTDFVYRVVMLAKKEKQPQTDAK
ncbi:hypothetical protein [Prevotella communis]|jgi:hypothetical protein|uniref:hypothetical protein n=1 Tax=Prevotella communis TaxID=2913614 RepID=UPI001EDA1AD3|nr:hypothetical protein [Prevotella communis]MCR5472503.1 hypothetical protein [Prevotella sp.]UKK57490.1 hypothetical protein L6476_04355 [Prevotella communis]UKK60171.1 hypothetical protein L6470_03935 [Prevotella communis]UKK62906.1 hypothetical protein L6468_03815 [Prevotella communis]UKK65731.1 hypothetical protein L6473_03815 [Prevotella communis]